MTKLWFSDGLQPKQLWFETKTKVLEVRAYNESQSGEGFKGIVSERVVVLFFLEIYLFLFYLHQKFVFIYIPKMC